MMGVDKCMMPKRYDELSKGWSIEIQLDHVQLGYSQSRDHSQSTRDEPGNPGSKDPCDDVEVNLGPG